MAEKAKMTERDATLISILERMSSQLNKHDDLLEAVSFRLMEMSERAENSELRIIARQNEVTATVEKLQESFSRYRSDMLSLVNEQDHTNKNMVELNSLIGKTVYSLEHTNHEISGLNDNVKAQEKTIGDHYMHSLEQAEIWPKELAEANHAIAKMHMDYEKNLGLLQKEMQRQLEKMQLETTRRLMVLVNIESAMQTLLIRTEPHKKRANLVVRLFRRISGFCRTRLSRLIRLIRPHKAD